MLPNLKTILMTNGSPIILNTTYPLIDLVFQKPPNSSSICPTTAYFNRLKTFNSGWPLDFITPRTMANAGFHYKGIKDRVGCSYCSREFDEWKHGDNPIVDHKRNSPQCAFFRQNSGFDICGTHGSLPSVEDHNEDLKMMEDIFKFSGVVKQIRASTLYSKFAVLENRLESFNGCHADLKVKISDLCEAGFFYIGDGQNDVMACFCCNQGLERWEDGDDAWIEHAKYNPSCSYVLLCKGKSFVDEACKSYEDEACKIVVDEACKVEDNVPKIKQVDLSKSISHDNALENNTIVDSTEKKLDDEEKSDIDSITTALSKIDLNTKELSKNLSIETDNSLCKICFRKDMVTAFIPCGHIFGCIQCTVLLDQCAVCRYPLDRVTKVFITKEEDKNTNLQKFSQDSEKPLNPVLCKVCQKKEKQALFLPCKHIFACIGCATKTDECVVCSKPYLCIIQVYIL